MQINLDSCIVASGGKHGIRKGKVMVHQKRKSNGVRKGKVAEETGKESKLSKDNLFV